MLTHILIILVLFISLCISRFPACIIFIMPKEVQFSLKFRFVGDEIFFSFWMSKKILFPLYFLKIFSLSIELYFEMSFFFSTSKIIIHYPLDCNVFTEKSAVILIFVPLYLRCLFSMAAFKTFLFIMCFKPFN